jgi:glycosyltransferase involved in cell wall biosynthesis
MCTFQGEEFLNEQLESIHQQTHTNWRLWVSDDRSNDGTRAILSRFQSRWGAERLSILAGPAAGSTANFLSLTDHDTVQGDFFAWADQDDVWEPDKLARAVQHLTSHDPAVPALYVTPVLLTDARGAVFGRSALNRSPGFANALVQNVAGGNTMVFNAATRRLLRQAGPKVSVVAHDWWAYLLVTGSGGAVLCDDHATLRYRQHARNQIGSTPGALRRTLRLRPLLNGQFRRWMDLNLEALERHRNLLSPSSLETVDMFASARRGSLAARLMHLRRSRVHRSSRLGNVALLFAVLCDRL